MSRTQLTSAISEDPYRAVVELVGQEVGVLLWDLPLGDDVAVQVDAAEPEEQRQPEGVAGVLQGERAGADEVARKQGLATTKKTGLDTTNTNVEVPLY